MLEFKCNDNIKQTVIASWIKKIKKAIKKYDIKTIVVNCYDSDIENKIKELVQITPTGFIFDKNDALGTESYGYISDFFEKMLYLTKEIKKEFQDIAIEGNIMMYDFGSYESVMYVKIHCSYEMKEPDFIEQLQCICCRRYVDRTSALKLIYDEDVIWNEDGECLYPQSFSLEEDGAVFCVCSEDCASNVYL